MDKTLQWIYAAECDGGGISAWKAVDGHWHKPYPEITGYVIPTLLQWGALDLAERCADWLLTQQNPDGSWNGLDDIPRPFDTSAIIEGLQAAYAVIGDKDYMNAAHWANIWMIGQISQDGYLVNSKGLGKPETYNLRASAIINNPDELEYRRRVGFPQLERSHYLAYALEGALNLGGVEFAGPHIEAAYIMQPGLVPFWVYQDWNSNGNDDMDYCATAQMGILYERMGMDAKKQYDLLTDRLDSNGGLAQGTNDRRQIAWAAKFYLDLKAVIEEK